MSATSSGKAPGEDGAVVKDREKGIYADPAKVHPIQHKGKYFSVPGAGLTEPSPPTHPP